MKKIIIASCILFAFHLTFAGDSKTPLLSLASLNNAKPVPKHPTFCELALIFFEKGDAYEVSIDTLGNWSEQYQENFITYLDQHTVEQTMTEYQLSEELVRNVVNSWAALGSSFVDLVAVMYGNVDSLTWVQVGTLLDSAKTCYYEENIAARMAPGCEEDWQICTDAADDWYLDRLESCFGIGLGLSTVSGGLGLGFGVGCIAIAAWKHNGKLKKCNKAFNECAN